jgi:hypothetical protein
MLMVFWVLSSQPSAQKFLSRLGGGSLFGHFHYEQLVLLALAFITVSLETVAFFLLMVQSSRSFKEAQNILTVPVLFMIAIPIILCYPNLELSPSNVWIPVLNVILSLRAAFSEPINYLLCGLAIAENLVISCFVFALIAIIVGKEDYLQGNARLTSLLVTVFSGSERIE